MNSVCFCEWIAPHDPFLCTYKTLKDSMDYEQKLVDLIRESSLSDTNIKLTDRDSGSSCTPSTRQPGSCATGSSSKSEDNCFYGEERISNNECYKRCSDFSRVSRVSIKKGFCSNGQCRCKYYKYGICLSKKLKSLEKREERETFRRLDVLANEIIAEGNNRLTREGLGLPCRRYSNPYHEM
ncbi:hypothetical protein QAD02_000320 [Eretmocerus hayati]|uniref:Uncharacterized protein n=1 Tax=Eretmocerus hayati TaxID=131215 RepID=A0ACC2NDT9_9HYME|nr:hypothetical protein QAD02_000320 [Eretmocerus hayati]